MISLQARLHGAALGDKPRGYVPPGGIRPFGIDRLAAKVARGGARMGKPRGARVVAMRGGGSLAARIVKVPPHCLSSA
jgi:hypothetical protein